MQKRVKGQTLEGAPWFDRKGAEKKLNGHVAPLYFLDFESISFVVPIWAGTRPYQQIVFQFSLHVLKADGSLEHKEFLDVSGHDPSQLLVAALVDACGTEGPVFVYNAGFEKSRMKEIGQRFSELSGSLSAISKRVVDLLPIARSHYYHPAQQGSWSIKRLLPAMVPDLRYEDLDGVQDGMGAMDAYREAADPATSSERVAEIERELKAYCGLDTYSEMGAET